MLKNNFTKFKETEQGLIPEDWDILKFGDMAELRNEKYLPNPNTFLSYIGLEHIDQQSLSLNSIGESATVGSIKSVFKSGDILFGKLRPYFRKVYRPKFDGICSTDIWVIKARDGIDQGYLHWFVANQDFVDMASSGGKGTKMPRADWDQLNISEWAVPSLPEQQKIAEVLGVLDEKIELNRKMNKTLESLAQTIFKKWFVDDADPNWETKKLGELIKVLSGFAFSSRDFDQDGKYGLVTIKNVQDGNFITDCTNRIDNPPSKMPDYIILQKGDIILSLTGNVGRVCFVYGNDNFLLNQRVAKLVPFNLRDYGYAYFLFRQKEFQEYLIAISKGTAQQNLSPVETAEIDVQFPGIEMLEKYSKIANPIMNKIVDNMNEIETLSQIRDSLLPKLMSGRIRL